MAVVLLASWIVAVVVTPGFASSWFGAVVVVPALLLCRVRVGATAGVLFAAADVLLAGDVPRHGPFVVHGVLSLIGTVVLTRSARPRAAPAETVRRHPYFEDAESPDRSRWRPGAMTWAAVVGGVIVLAAIADGQHDLGAWLLAGAFGVALALAGVADRRARRRARQRRPPVYAF